MTLHAKAVELLRLHTDPSLLKLVNVWDPVSARVVAEVPGTTALATASHSIAASYGYPDGERIPAKTMIEAVGRIAATTELPVTADLEAGYGSPGETVRKAIGVGVVGANIEDELKPVRESVAAVEAAVTAAEAEGVPFVLNARTDAYLRAPRDRTAEQKLADAVERGRAFLDAGAACVFVPGQLDEPTVRSLVEAFGPQRLSVIGSPGVLPLALLEQLGVARISYGPWSQRVALTALGDLAADVIAGGALPDGTRSLN